MTQFKTEALLAATLGDKSAPQYHALVENARRALAHGRLVDPYKLT